MRWLQRCGVFSNTSPARRSISFADDANGEVLIILFNFLRLTVTMVPTIRDNSAAISSALHHCDSSKYQSQRGNVRIGLHMIKHSMDGLLFFEGGRELRISAYDISRTKAQVHADGLGLLPIRFYITFDNFLTVGKCRLLWRYGDDIGVVFERWLDVRQRLAADQAGSGNCGQLAARRWRADARRNLDSRLSWMFFRVQPVSRWVMADQMTP